MSWILSGVFDMCRPTPMLTQVKKAVDILLECRLAISSIVDVHYSMVSSTFPTLVVLHYVTHAEILLS